MADKEWTINYLPESGGRITGKLKLTDTDIIFDGIYDSSNAEIVKGIGGAIAVFAASGGHIGYHHNTDSDFGFALPRADVDHAELRKKRLMKQAIITMKDGSIFVFDYGMLNPKHLVNAINN